MVTIGVIGTGPTADVHRKRYNQLDDVETVKTIESVQDGNTTRVQDVINTVDAVDVCSPPSTHQTIIESALSQDVDVLCVPPFGTNMGDASAIASAARDSDGTVLAGHVSRFSPGHVDVRESVQDGAVGEPGVIRVTRSIPTVHPDEWHDWYADDGNTGDVLLDFALHDFDYLRWIVGSIERVYTRFRSAEQTEHAVTLVRFSNGATAHVETVHGSLPELEYRVEMDIAGSEGLIQYDTAEAAAFEQITTNRDASNPYSEPPLTDGDGRDGYYYMLDHFVSCIGDGTQPSVTADDGAQAHRLAAAARQSAEIGRPVTIEEVES